MAIIHAELCDIGLARSVNQDSILTCVDSTGENGIFLVSDGMGGHTGGEIASGIIRDGLKKWWNDNFSSENVKDARRLMQAIQNCIEEANREIYEKYNKNTVCGATCIILLILGDSYMVFNAGDSRVYRQNGRALQSIMVDETWENQPHIRNRFSKQQILTNPNYGKLVNAIGTNPEINISVLSDSIKKDDIFLLCSDGLYKFCDEKKIKKILRRNKKKPEEIPQLLLKEVYSAGARDNVSIIVVKKELSNE